MTEIYCNSLHLPASTASTWSLMLLYILHLVTKGMADVLTVGHEIIPRPHHGSNDQASWIDVTSGLPTSVVIRWRLYCRLPFKPVHLQVWRPVEDDTYRLVSSHRVIPTSLGVYVYELPSANRTLVQTGDRFGFTNEQDEGPIAFAFTPDHGHVIRYVNMSGQTEPEVNEAYTFETYRYGRIYSVNVDVVTCSKFWSVIDTECARFSPDGADWEESRDYCRRNDGDLVMLKSADYTLSIRRHMVIRGLMVIWAGVMHNTDSWSYTWVDGQDDVMDTPIAWSSDPYWAPDGLCVAFSVLNKWLLRNCSTVLPFLCQARPGDRQLYLTELSEGYNDTRPNVTSQTFTYKYDDVISTESTTSHTGTVKVKECDPNNIYGMDDECLNSTITPDNTTSVVFYSIQDQLRLLENFLEEQSEGRGENSSDVTIVETVELLQQLAATLPPDPKDNTTGGATGLDTMLYMEHLTEAAQVMLDTDCSCAHAWRKAVREQSVGPMEAVEALEGAVSGIMRQHTDSIEGLAVEFYNTGIGIHLDVVRVDDETLTSAAITPGYTYTTPHQQLTVTIPTHVFPEDGVTVVGTVVYRSMHELLQQVDNTSISFQKLHTINANQSTINSKLVSISTYPRLKTRDSVVKETATPPTGSDIDLSFHVQAHRKLIKRRVSDVNLTADVTADVTGAWTMFNNYDFGDLYISPDVEVKDDDLMSRSQVDEEPPVVVEFTVKHVNDITYEAQSPVCVFWNYSLPGPGGWDTAGCKVSSWNQTHTTCRCQHLTNFAVLVHLGDISRNSRADDTALSLLTFIGCGLSIGGLLITLFVHLVCRCFTERARILLNLCLALLVADSVFIGGVNSTDQRMVCLIVAVALHYFYLSAFFWMLVQGIELFIKLKKVFHTGSRIMHYCIIGWGLPAIILAVGVGMRHEDYGRDNYCWLSSRTGLIWSFIAPVIFICAANLVVLCMVIRTFHEPRPGKHGGQSSVEPRPKERAAARASLILLPVLGCGWLVGLLYIGKHTIIFQYIFAAFNSSQGFFIFLFHCAFNDEIRTLWRMRVQPEGPLGMQNGSDLSDEGLRSATRTDHTSVSRIGSQQPVMAKNSLESTSSSEEGTPGRGWGLGWLLPGRSKMVSITKPRKSRQQTTNCSIGSTSA